MSREKRVPIVEDDSNIYKNLEESFGIVGLATISFATAEAFLRKYKMDLFKAAVFDNSLAGEMTGVELTERIRKGGDNKLIIVGTSMDEVGKDFISAGANNFYPKQAGGRNLAQLVASLIK